MEALYLENLEELVNDENKVVTYKLLSSTLNVHVNQAKQMLYAFVNDQRNKKENDALYVTYFVAGLTRSDHGPQIHKCAVIPEEALSAYKSSMSVLTSSHIYSVQKSKLQDSSMLYTADYDVVRKNIHDAVKHSSIKHPSVKMRSESEKKKVMLPPQKTEDSVVKKQNGNTDSKCNVSKPAPKKGGIAGMFANQAEKKPTEKVASSEDKKEDKKPQNENKGNKKSVMNFFANHTGKKSESNVDVKKEEGQAIKKEDISSKMDKKKTGRKTGRTNDTEKDDPKRKRRRIVQESDSSSEEEMEYESPVPSPVREPTPPLPEREPSPVPESPDPKEMEEIAEKPITKAVTGERLRKRRRKLVPKTFMDDEGYMVTEKVWESESTDASDVEAPPPVKKATPVKKTSPAKKTSPKKKSPPSTGSRKQMALTSFFTKK